MYAYSNALSHELEAFPGDKYIQLQTVLNVAVEITKEYEHFGEVELLNVNIEQFKTVLLDYLLYLTTYILIQEEANATDHSRSR